jgi:hypothetical protein
VTVRHVQASTIDLRARAGSPSKWVSTLTALAVLAVLTTELLLARRDRRNRQTGTTS